MQSLAKRMLGQFEILFSSPLAIQILHGLGKVLHRTLHIGLDIRQLN